MYYKMKNRLISIFKQNDFISLYNRKEQKYIEVRCNLDDKVKIVYPGYKTKIENNIVKSYDYRVEYGNLAVSHVNIVVDLFNKSIQAPWLRELLEEFIIEIAVEGKIINRGKYRNIYSFEYQKPNIDLINKIDYIHKKNGKKYLIEGNREKSYSIKELECIIPLIVLQEDINYPMPRYEGRRMSFYRYVEAIWCDEVNRSIDEVIIRTLSHDRPMLWNEIDYDNIKKLSVRNMSYF